MQIFLILGSVALHSGLPVYNGEIIQRRSETGAFPRLLLANPDSSSAVRAYIGYINIQIPVGVCNFHALRESQTVYSVLYISYHPRFTQHVTSTIPRPFVVRVERDTASLSTGLLSDHQSFVIRQWRLCETSRCYFFTRVLVSSYRLNYRVIWMPSIFSSM